MMAIWESSVKATHNFLAINDINALKPAVKRGLLMIDQLYGYYDQKLLGFIGVEGGKIEMLFIDANALNQGIGKKLLQYVIDTLRIKYVDVNEQNEKALGFYQHMGFQVTSRSELDEQGNAFPILHLKMKENEDSLHEN
ncbi:GNAT family N-acetyltransferase [Enterococcus hulanensis]|nr:GNAT family N-acetyltransferase [Enterococcus hulanensis]